jgi:hypothetical protein
LLEPRNARGEKKPDGCVVASRIKNGDRYWKVIAIIKHRAVNT